MIIRYEIPKGICHYEKRLWQPQAEKAGIRFNDFPKPICIRDLKTGQLVIIQEREDSGADSGNMPVD